MPTWSSRPVLDPGARLAHTLAALHAQRVPGAQAAAAELARLLAGYGRDEREWRRSTLTADGFPCEFTFGSGKPCVRYALEPAAASPQARLAICEALLDAAGVTPLAAVMRNRVKALHSGAALAYGAWIGARHDAAGARYKLYIEVPAHGAGAAARDMLRDYLGHAGAHLRCPLRMLGCDPQAGTLEFYFRSDGALPPQLLAPRAPDGPAPDQTATLAALMARTARRGPSGFSLAQDAGGRMTATSRYVFANRAFGADPQLRRRVLRFAAACRWDPAAYAAASAPAAGANGAGGHGLLAWITPLDGPAEIRLGLNPPRPGARHLAAANPTEE